MRFQLTPLECDVECAIEKSVYEKLENMLVAPYKFRDHELNIDVMLKGNPAFIINICGKRYGERESEVPVLKQ